MQAHRAADLLPAGIALHHGAMVLLVDDQVMVGEAIRRALASEPDIEFHYCSDPAEALKTAVQMRPTVILQDLVLPGVDGLTLVQAYRAHPVTKDIPIIVLSTREDPVVKSAAFASGANDYLVKLPDAIELVARLRYHSRSYLALVQRDEAYQALRQSQQQLLESNMELRRLTNSDGLTGLGNRRYLDEYLAAEWARAHREQRELSLLMIDVDHFKLFNDLYGHIAGDEALKRVAGTIFACCDRSSDLAARFGGEEFAMVLPGKTAGSARLTAEKLRRNVEALQIPHAEGGTGPWLTVSLGVSTLVPASDRPYTDLIEQADRGLYEAKRQGRNRVVQAPDG
ncbi:diguanylate cyclase [Bordetella hinzii]|uniref:diguanylate cyclase n=1 Tax=Bordetella hinzii TaxID=103855 RepID=A0AAN1RYX1_9BORD|nr:diguanylate cyclase [Bordetella hinzii]AKQ56703.1 Phytochrome-like protein cph2 [Bordetella hinzii]AKQ61161.1 Phytochrome-like protein cph2 [Bordetella hinzii]AZW17842.1 diguanylate cyclase response regulator [Bordetella hinzii]KXA71705.1 diguanylate cyclase response regulator [Bordetella hinzii LMG 13501]MBZ0075818.1 diguanylate cyclase [Bordetella hinzii]